MSKFSYTIHGGAWVNNAVGARVAYRNHIRPGGRSGLVGFRIVEEHGIYVVRGGALLNNAACARASFRLNILPDYHHNYVGFRTVEEEVKE